MSLLTSSPPGITTVGDLLDSLGGISPDRVRYRPALGTATEQDVIDIEARENRLCELVDGVLVEKAMRFNESYVAGVILMVLNQFVIPRKQGIVTGADGMMRLFPGLVRIPDVAFVSRGRLPGGRLSNDAIPSLVPDLAVEVLSEGNTVREMTRKRGEYFDAGVRLLWIVDPKLRTVAVYTDPQGPTILDETQTLTGGTVLPGFSVAIKSLFEELP
ncbi:MAG TPA: Uma2 family endonuclease [Tepidisphaeraceae bacterium]|jgi:Uma2 family endonuclease|nr:Uma2 family endonuclease [Tepidisphaeraceae bacterium]